MGGCGGGKQREIGGAKGEFRPNNPLQALAGPPQTRILCGSKALDTWSGAPSTRPAGPTEIIDMAKSQFKAGGPTRGRKRLRKKGMGSGQITVAKHKKRKG